MEAQKNKLDGYAFDIPSTSKQQFEFDLELLQICRLIGKSY
jgi:hypothetical protein